MGRFLAFKHFLRKASGDLFYPFWKMENSKKIFFEFIDLYRRGHDFLGHALYKGQKVVFLGVKRPSSL
jgi:hypothetical protein